MSRGAGRILTGAMTLLLAASPPGWSQVSLGGSATLATPYVWRGLTRANGATLQPEGFLAARLGSGYLTVGAWANYELGPRSPGNLSDLGSDRPGWSEVNYWLQLARPIGDLETTLGAIHYRYPADAPDAVRTEDDNTTELYGAVQLTSTYLVPRLTAYLDVDHVQGMYLEGSATVPLLAYPFGNPIVFYAHGVAGFNLGQELNPDRPTQGANFRHDGFTHFDLSLRATAHLPVLLPLTINLEPHWQLKVDEFTKRTSPEAGDAERNLQFWFALSVSTSLDLVPGARR